jgi:hypothetical protein
VGREGGVGEFDGADSVARVGAQHRFAGQRVGDELGICGPVGDIERFAQPPRAGPQVAGVLVQPADEAGERRGELQEVTVQPAPGSVDRGEGGLALGHHGVDEEVGAECAVGLPVGAELGREVAGHLRGDGGRIEAGKGGRGQRATDPGEKRSTIHLSDMVVTTAVVLEIRDEIRH